MRIVSIFNMNWAYLSTWLLTCLLMMPSQNFTIVRKKKCQESRFHCGSDVFIPFSWICDGASDCADGSDELGCSKTVSHSNNFIDIDFHSLISNNLCIYSAVQHCGDGVRCGDECVDATWLCDGKQDCRDGSDEENCGNLTCLNLAPHLLTGTMNCRCGAAKGAL